MKKLLFTFTLSLVFILTLCNLPTQVLAVDERLLDQSQTEGGDSIVVYKEYYRNQTFKVTKNVITHVEVFLKNRHQGDIVTLQLKNESTGWPIVTLENHMGTGDGWETFDLTGEGLSVFLDTDDTYSLWIGTAYYSENATAWYYTSTDVYPDGQRRTGLTPVRGDHVFKIYGYDLFMERFNPETEQLPVDNTEEDTNPVDNTEESDPKDNTPIVDTEDQVDNTSDESEKDISEETVIPDKPINKVDINETDIDNSIVVPTLEFIIIDNFVVEPKDGVVNANKDSIIKIVGVAGEQDNIFVTIGDKTYTAKADENGNWYIIVSTTDLEENSLPVSVFAENENGKVSNKGNLFELIISDYDDQILTTNKEEDSDFNLKLIFFITAISILILILLFVYLKKKKNEKKVDIIKSQQN